MNIAIASLVNRKVQKAATGGTETFTYNLIEGLAKKGHKISLYASNDSESSAENKGIIDSITASSTALNEKLVHPYRILTARNLALDAENYDLIHDNFFNSYLVSSFAPFIKKPIVHTIHNLYFSDPTFFSLMEKIGFQQNQHFVFISQNSMKFAENVPNKHMIYNGIDVDKYSFNEKSSDYLFWISRMIPDKGADKAIEVAKFAQKKAILQSFIRGSEEQIFFDTLIKGNIGQNITFLNDSSEETKLKNYQNAKAFIFPIQWEEPFGLVLTEAMSCGTPVIAYARGAVPEVVKDGITGYIVNSSESDIRGDFIIKKTGLEGLLEAVEKIYGMTEDEYIQMRANCRSHVEEKFMLSKMVDAYESVYEEILRG